MISAGRYALCFCGTETLQLSLHGATLCYTRSEKIPLISLYSFILSNPTPHSLIYRSWCPDCHSKAAFRQKAMNTMFARKPVSCRLIIFGDIYISVIDCSQYNHVCCNISVVEDRDRLENLKSHVCSSRPVQLCCTTLCQPKLALASNIRRRGGINYDRFNHHFCTASVIEVQETLDNLTTLCLRSHHDPVVCEVEL